MNQEVSVTTEKPKKRKYSAVSLMLFVGYVLLLFYLVIPVFLWSPLYTSFVLFPSGHSEASYSEAIKSSKIKPEEHSFPNSNNNKLHGWLFKKPGAEKIILVHHGNAGNISTRLMLSNELTDCGASVFMYDYRGYGASTGWPTLDGLLEDGVAASDYLIDKLGYRPNQVIHYGESIGSGIACHAAAAGPNGGLVLQSAVGSLPRVGRNALAFLRPYPDFVFPNPQLQNVETIRRVNSPVLLIHGIPDTIVFANAIGKKKLVLLKTSGHNSVIGEDFEVFDKEIRDFISGRSQLSQ